MAATGAGGAPAARHRARAPAAAPIRSRSRSAIAARIAHVHAKDVRTAVCEQALREDWSFLTAVLAGVFTVPGDGCVDFAPVFAALPRLLRLGRGRGRAGPEARRPDDLRHAWATRTLRQLLAGRLVDERLRCSVKPAAGERWHDITPRARRLALRRVRGARPGSRAQTPRARAGRREQCLVLLSGGAHQRRRSGPRHRAARGAPRSRASPVPVYVPPRTALVGHGARRPAMWRSARPRPRAACRRG